MTSSSPKKPRITALIQSRIERRSGRLAVGGLCAALVAGAGLLLAGPGVEERIVGGFRQPPAAPPACPVPFENDLVVFPEAPAAAAELAADGGDGILLVSGGADPDNGSAEAEVVLAFGNSMEGVDDNDYGIILVSAGATEPEAAK